VNEYVAGTRQTKNAHNILVGIPSGKWLVRRLDYRWEDNIVACSHHAVTVEAIETSRGTQQ
jgi:hypothetical protein